MERLNSVGTSIWSVFSDNMVLNPPLCFLSDITCGGFNSKVYIHILIYMTYFTHFLYSSRVLQVAKDATEIIFPTNISAFVDDKNFKY